MPMPTLRPATPADISGMHRVRLAVRENRLTSTAITEADYVPAILSIPTTNPSVVTWLWSQGLERLWLTTEPGTRAEVFYAARGWERVVHNNRGEIRFELSRGPP
jgi:hypothetical protein